MPIEIKITGEHADDALRDLQHLAGALALKSNSSILVAGVEAGKTPEAPTAPAATDIGGWDAPKAPTPAEPPKRGRGRPSKQNKPTESSAPTVPPVAGDPPAQEQDAAVSQQSDPAPAVPLDHAEFRKQLMTMAPIEDNEKSEKAIAIINAAGYAKLKEVKPEDYESILAKVAEAVGA